MIHLNHKSFGIKSLLRASVALRKKKKQLELPGIELRALTWQFRSGKLTGGGGSPLSSVVKSSLRYGKLNSFAREGAPPNEEGKFLPRSTWIKFVFESAVAE